MIEFKRKEVIHGRSILKQMCAHARNKTDLHEFFLPGC